LDEKQKTNNNRTPVDQAFEYAPKMGGKCDWVIVSNIKEIRFYPSDDRSKCQIFFLKDLMGEPKQKELFFLFHKDRFIKQVPKSSTDILFEKSKIIQPKDEDGIHIIDKIYNSLKRFESFGFVDPNYVVSIYPFNILDEYVWHYQDGTLFTINTDIYSLLNGINVENGEIMFTDEMRKEIEDLIIVDYKYKLERVFRFLNYCSIEKISAIKNYKHIAERNKKTIGFSPIITFPFKEGEEGVTKEIRILKDDICDCLSCNYRTFDFNKFLVKLKTGADNDRNNPFEYAYGNYLAATMNFKTTYHIYNSITKQTKGQQGKEIEYFLAKLNTKNLYNLIKDYQYEDRQEMISNIKSLDLDKVIYDEIEFGVDKQVKDYLISVKDDSFIYNIREEIDEILFKIEKLKLLYERGDRQYFGSDLSSRLSQKYFLLYLYINRNFIIYDIFNPYVSLTEKMFKGLVNSYCTPEFGLKLFHGFFLTEAIIHINSGYLKEILEPVHELKVVDGCVDELLQKLKNFSTSYYKSDYFSRPKKNPLIIEQLHSYKFKYRITNIFSNLFTIISRLNISKTI